jgi:hypothetical protein
MRFLKGAKCRERVTFKICGETAVAGLSPQRTHLNAKLRWASDARQGFAAA